MRRTLLLALALGTAALAAWPGDSEAQTRRATRYQQEAYPGAGYAYDRPRTRTRITVRRARSYLDPGTEVLPRSQNYTDYAFPPLWYPSKSWDAAGARRYPLPDSYYLPGYFP